MGWGGIITNVVVALKCVTRCGCFEVTCHARAVWVWGGVGGVGRDNYKCCIVALKCVTRCGCFEDPCSTSRTRCVGVGWGVGRGGIIINVVVAVKGVHVVVVLKIHVACHARAC